MEAENQHLNEEIKRLKQITDKQIAAAEAKFEAEAKRFESYKKKMKDTKKVRDSSESVANTPL